jgi:hypothetical protein
MEYGRTAYNRSVYAKRLAAFWATKKRSRATPFVRFFSATFWPAAMLRIALWAGQNVIYIPATVFQLLPSDVDYSKLLHYKEVVNTHCV